MNCGTRLTSSTRAGRRIEIDRQKPRPAAALAAPRLARHHGRGPAGALRHPHHGRLKARLERRRRALR